MRITRRLCHATAATAAALLSVVGVAGYGGSVSPAAASTASGVTLQAVLWDPTQVASYQACANAFKKKTGITVKLTQTAWAQYWSNLTTELAAGKGPDIITDHVGYYPQLEASNQLVNLAPYFKADGYKPASTGITTNSLWERGSKIYGISQDRDAVQLLYNTKDTSKKSVAHLTWNPTNGGTFGALVKHLTIDDNGVRGDQPGFDKNHVKTYGFSFESGDGIAGQSSWATFALDMGWYWTTPRKPFATKYNMADPRLAKVFQWVQRMYENGYFAPIAQVASLGITPVLDQNIAAMSFQGAWTVGSYAPTADKSQAYAWAPLPTGPSGKTMTISNSLAQSVLSVSQHKAQAAKWVEFVGSKACQNLVAKKAVVFPSIPSEAKVVAKEDQKKGIDVSSFVKVLGTKSDLVDWPITDQGTQINQLATNAFDNELFRGEGTPSSVLADLNSSINSLF
jgi:multiple sugar transport system substrate-binding protein